MLYEINTSNIQKINWHAKGTARIIQNISNLLGTIKYEIAYDRTLGLSGSFVDKPLSEAIAEATTEIYENISSREPRAKVNKVEYLGLNKNNCLIFRVVIEI